MGWYPQSLKGKKNFFFWKYNLDHVQREETLIQAGINELRRKTEQIYPTVYFVHFMDNKVKKHVNEVS